MGLLDATEQDLDLAPDAETLEDVNFCVCVSFCPMGTSSLFGRKRFKLTSKGKKVENYQETLT